MRTILHDTKEELNTSNDDLLQAWGSWAKSFSTLRVDKDHCGQYCQRISWHTTWRKERLFFQAKYSDTGKYHYPCTDTSCFPKHVSAHTRRTVASHQSRDAKNNSMGETGCTFTRNSLDGISYKCICAGELAGHSAYQKKKKKRALYHLLLLSFFASII